MANVFVPRDTAGRAVNYLVKKVILVLVVKVYACVRITVPAIQSVVHVAANQAGGVSTAVDRVPMGDSVMGAKKFATALPPVTPR